MREVCGLTTEEIASAFLTTPPTIRAAHRSREIQDPRRRSIPYEVPSLANIPERLESVLTVIYLVFNEGYSASSGQSVTRADLSERSHPSLSSVSSNSCPIRRSASAFWRSCSSTNRAAKPEHPRIGRSDSCSKIKIEVTWNRAQITKKVRRWFSARSARANSVSYTLQAAISAIHADAVSTDKTDWAQIVALYDLLLRAQPSPVVRLNRAVAVAMRDGPAAGLQLIDEILAKGDLADYHLGPTPREPTCTAALGK